MCKLEVREAQIPDLKQLLELYTQLHNNEMPEMNDELEQRWQSIILDNNHHIIVGLVESRIVCSCVLLIVPNLTHHQRPYALIENVITHQAYRNKGYATKLLDYARDIANEENCYKIMLLTGAKKESTLNFYEKAGYNRNDKTAFIQWLD